MNIPESITEVGRGTSAESLLPTSAADRPPGQTRATDAVQGDPSASDATATMSRETVNSLVADMESRFADNNIQLRFNVLDENDTVQVEILDADGKTVRKIPSDELVTLSKSLKNLDRGLIDRIS